MEPVRRIELRLPPYQGGVLAVTTEQARAERPGLEPGSSRVKAGRVCRFPTAHQSPHPVPPGLAVRTRNARSLDPGAACPRRDSNAHCPPPQGGASCRWATRTWSRHPVPTRVTRLTRAGPQPCAAAKMAILASNQETPGSEPGGSAIFPQWPSGAEGAIRTRRPRGLSSRGIPVPFTPASCATWDLNPDRDTG